MLRRERKYLGPNLVKLSREVLQSLGVDFVDGDDERLARSPQAPSQLQIERSRTGTSVDYKHESGCVGYRGLRLLENLAGDGRAVVGQQTSGVHDFKRPPEPGGSAVNTIASDPRLVRDDRAAGSCEPIEERRLPYVWAPNDNDGWRFLIHVSVASLADLGSAYPIRWPGYKWGIRCPPLASTRQKGSSCASRSGCSKFVAALNRPSGWRISPSFLNEWPTTDKPPSWPFSCTNPFTFRPSKPERSWECLASRFGFCRSSAAAWQIALAFANRSRWPI